MKIPSETKQFIAKHINDDIRSLALKKQSFSSSNIDFPLAIRQISGRQAIKNKVPSWYENEAILYPEHLPLEQCSSELTAQYKSSLVNGKILVDLTGGFGVDCVFMAIHFERAFYVERQIELCKLAEHNFYSLNISNIDIYNDDSFVFLKKMEKVDCLFIDPARRDEHGRKTILLSDCEPDVSVIQSLLLEKSETVMIKLSPMLDITLALKSLPPTTEIHVVSVNNECKELLFILKKEPCEEPVIHCLNFSINKKRQYFRFLRSEEQKINCLYTSDVRQYLYEPNVSLLKSGAFKILTQKFGIEKLHPDSHLYTSDTFFSNFPGRIFQVQSVFLFHKNDIKRQLQDISQANISIRNFPDSVDKLRKKMKLKDGGETYLFATTLGNGKKVIIRSVRLFISANSVNSNNSI